MRRIKYGVTDRRSASENTNPLRSESWGASDDMAEHLELGHDAGGPRYYLSSRAVHAGAHLELLLPCGQWLSGRYEWDWRSSGAPRFYFAIGGSWEGNPDFGSLQACTPLPADAVLRWPRNPR